MPYSTKRRYTPRRKTGRKAFRKTPSLARRTKQYANIQLKCIIQDGLVIPNGGTRSTHQYNAVYVMQNYCSGYTALSDLYDEFKINSVTAKVQYMGASGTYTAPLSANMESCWDRNGLEPSQVTSPFTVTDNQIQPSGYESMKVRRIDITNKTMQADSLWNSIIAAGVHEKTVYISTKAKMAYAAEETVAGLTPTLIVQLNTSPYNVGAETTCAINLEFMFNLTVRCVRQIATEVTAESEAWRQAFLTEPIANPVNE